MKLRNVLKYRTTSQTCANLYSQYPYWYECAREIEFKIRADRVETTHDCLLESHTPEQARFDLPKQSNQNTVMEQGFNANGPHVQAY